MFVCLLDELIVGFCYSHLTWKTSGFKRASTTLVLQANQLAKCANDLSNAKRKTIMVFLCWISMNIKIGVKKNEMNQQQQMEKKNYMNYHPCNGYKKKDQKSPSELLARNPVLCK